MYGCALSGGVSTQGPGGGTAPLSPLKNIVARPPNLTVHLTQCGRLIFTARCYASAVLAMALCPSVCLSVRHKSVFY